MNTCDHCGTTFEGRKRKYCTKACSSKASRDSGTKTCTAPDCEKPVRARNLCSTHYNQTRPNRHPKVEVPCAWCGALVAKERRTSRKPVCSTRCRSNIQNPPVCVQPEDHWAWWWGKTSQWPRYGFKTCWWCKLKFVPKSPISTTCGPACPESPRNKLANRIRQCEDCGEGYRSPWGNVLRCDTCATLHRRAGNYGSSWISRTRREAIYQRDNYKCHLCGKPTDPTADHWGDDFPSLDHLVPRSKGGSDRDYNLKTAHRLCNALRQDEELQMLQLA